MRYNQVTIVFLIFFMGCTTAGNLSSSGNPRKLFRKSPSVEVRLAQNLEYWWGPWEPDLKDRVASYLKEYFRKAGLSVVDSNSDLVVFVKRIDTGGWTGGIVITNIDVVGLKDTNEIFVLNYKQHSDSFTVKSILRPSKDERQVSKLLAKEIVKKLKAN